MFLLKVLKVTLDFVLAPLFTLFILLTLLVVFLPSIIPLVLLILFKELRHGCLTIPLPASLNFES